MTAMCVFTYTYHQLTYALIYYISVCFSCKYVENLKITSSAFMTYTTL